MLTLTHPDDLISTMTKREYIAIHIMAARYSSNYAVTDIEEVAEDSIKAAEILMAKLNIRE